MERRFSESGVVCSREFRVLKTRSVSCVTILKWCFWPIYTKKYLLAVESKLWMVVFFYRYYNEEMILVKITLTDVWLIVVHILFCRLVSWPQTSVKSRREVHHHGLKVFWPNVSNLNSLKAIRERWVPEKTCLAFHFFFC